MKRVLVTGATGFIGRHTVRTLLERGFEVHIAARAAAASTTRLAVHRHAVNLLDDVASRELISSVRPTHLLHLAWTTKPATYWTDIANLDWLSASICLVKNFMVHGGERVVGAGSVAEYDWRYGYCSESLTPLNSRSLYGTTKNGLRAVLDSLRLQEDLSSAWGRVFFTYGPGEADGRLVSSVTKRILEGEIAPCTLGAQIRDYLYVEDAARALVSLLDSNVCGPVNIASGFPLPVRELATQIGREVGRLDLVRLGMLKDRADDAPLLVADVHRLMNELGWRPEYSLKSGIASTVEWWREQLARSKTERA
jgi:nucleoside-diphosphate-sugar epimerase